MNIFTINIATGGVLDNPKVLQNANLNKLFQVTEFFV